MAPLRDIGRNLKNFKAYNKPNHDPKPKTQNGYQNRGNNNNTRGGERGKKCGHGQIGTNRKDCAVELKEIQEDIIAERKTADMCLMYENGPHKWFECYAKNPVVTRTVLKKGGVPQVRDTSKKQNTEEVKISAGGIEDEYLGIFFIFFFFFLPRNPAFGLVPWQGDAIPRHPKGRQKRRKSYIHNHHGPRRVHAEGTDLLANL